MCSKVFWILFVFVNISAIKGQDEFIECYSYFVNLPEIYTCFLKIYNPNGFDNFTDISGEHLLGKTDDDVLHISAYITSETPIIPSIICEKYKNLIRISFSMTGLSKIDENSLKNCAKLTSLDIYPENIVDGLDENAFIHNLELQQIHMAVTNLTSLPENVFRNQQKLEFLWLRSNLFSDLPKNVFKPVKNLIGLGLDSNLFTNLRPEWFEPLENLKYLQLTNNQLEELPANIFSSLVNLEQISLDQNKFKVVHSDWFGFLPNLKEIYLIMNQIYAIDEKLLDNTGVNEIGMLRNVCADKNIVDNSSTKELIRSVLKQCFENYENIKSRD